MYVNMHKINIGYRQVNSRARTYVHVYCVDVPKEYYTREGEDINTQQDTHTYYVHTYVMFKDSSCMLNKRKK